MKALLVQCLWIGVAGSCGALARYGISKLVGRMVVTSFPLGTFLINISGCLFLGWFLTYCQLRGVSSTTRLAIGTGFVGAYTTFSTFIFETNQLAGVGAYLLAGANIVGSVALGVASCWLGVMLARIM